MGLSRIAWQPVGVRREGRALVDPEVRLVDESREALFAGEEVGPDGQPGSPDSRLTERLVERALETRARVSPVEGAAEGALSDAAGIAALLRWLRNTDTDSVVFGASGPPGPHRSRRWTTACRGSNQTIGASLTHS